MLTLATCTHQSLKCVRFLCEIGLQRSPKFDMYMYNRLEKIRFADLVKDDKSVAGVSASCEF